MKALSYVKLVLSPFNRYFILLVHDISSVVTKENSNSLFIISRSLFHQITRSPVANIADFGLATGENVSLCTTVCYSKIFLQFSSASQDVCRNSTSSRVLAAFSISVPGKMLAEEKWPLKYEGSQSYLINPQKESHFSIELSLTIRILQLIRTQLVTHFSLHKWMFYVTRTRKIKRSQLFTIRKVVI